MADVVDVAIDAGQTGMRIGLARAGQVLRREDCAGLSYQHELSPSAAILKAISEPWTRLALRRAVDGRVGTLCLGLTSVLGSESEYAALAAGLLDLLDADRVLIAGDVVTAHAGAHDFGPGVVLAAGTGAIALGVDADGHHRQVDGWGYLCGDAGGGFWIGRQGLDAALRGHDGRATPGPLTSRAADVFGDLRNLAEVLYPAPDAVARIAGFAPVVLDLSGSDPAAAQIVAQAADELALTVAAAAGPDALQVSWTGRLLRHDGLRQRFAEALRVRLPGGTLIAPAGDGLTGAARLAASPDLGLYAGLVRVATR